MASKIIVPGIVAGIVILVVSMAISTLAQSIFNYNVLTLAGMRTVDDPIMLLFFLQPFVTGFAMAILYNYTKTSFKGNTMQKGKLLGMLGWFVYGIPSAFIVFTSMNYPIGFTINSVIGSFAYMMAAGWTITKLSN